MDINMQSSLLKCQFESCNKTYGSTFNLKRHVEVVHLGLRRFKCDICGRSLSSKQNLLDHQNVHTGAKPYVCTHSGCRCAFRQLCQLYIHRQLHKDIAIYSSKNMISKNILSLLVRRITKCCSEEDWKMTEPGMEFEILPKIESKKEGSKLPILEVLCNEVDKKV